MPPRQETAMHAQTKARLTRRSLVAAAGGASALALAGVPLKGLTQAQATPYDGEEATISYGFWDSAQQAAVEAQIAAFKGHFPNITVEPQICLLYTSDAADDLLCVD